MCGERTLGRGNALPGSQKFFHIANNAKTRPSLSIRPRSEIVNTQSVGPKLPGDIIGILADRERENMIQGLREKLACAQNTLQGVQEKIRKISSNKSKRNTFANKHLHSSMALEAGLREHWYPVEFEQKLPLNAKREFEIFDSKYTLTRVNEETVTCTSTSGDELQIVLKDGLVWAYPGSDKPPAVPDYTKPPSGYEIHAELEMEVPVEHGLLMENLLDLAHAPFTHTSTFAKGWSVPDSVKFHAANMLSGSWDPYPIDMAFDIPCMVNSKIGLVQVGKAAINLRADQCDNHLHQLHVCIPSGEGKTRLLYRMSLDMDGLSWTKQMPGVNLLWKAIAEQVLSEDTALVLGQQDRLKRGANTWENPVSYDKLGVRYRRWRNSLDSGDEVEKVEALRAVKKRMTAGELFHIEE
uniref:Pheophorbide a oxygenase domain-containing protein n=1 Tax=Amorphochlora amoebiformis TaxID=1561963 RepID=A0A7S0DGW1_9EUKA